MSILNHVWLAQLLGGITSKAEALIGNFGVEELYSVRNSAEFRSKLTTAQQKKLVECDLTQPKEILRQCENKGIDILTISDSNYPKQLLELKNPPLVLYFKGDIGLLNNGYRVAVVGTRTPSKYGSDVTEMLTKSLCEHNITIVSGLAEGLDGIANAIAVEEGTATIAVLGNSVDVYYPLINRELQLRIERCGLVISETAPSVSGYANSFLLRNRIIAAISDAVLVTEARTRSGALDTAKKADKLGRKLFAVPGSILSPLCKGTNTLIRQGAGAVVDAGSLLRDCGFTSEKKPKQKNDIPEDDLSELAMKILKEISPDGIVTELLHERLNEPTSTVLVALTELELFGIIERSVGGRIHKIYNR